MIKKLLLLALSLTAAVLWAQTSTGVHGVYLNPAASLANCAWPQGATVTNGVALCFINSNGNLSLALAANGGPFVSVSGAQGPAGIQGIQGVPGAQGPPGVVVGSKLTVSPVCAKGQGTIQSGWSSPSCVLTVTAVN